MAKWINTATGLEVPANEVREAFPGSGIFVHETTVTARRIEVTGGGGGRRPAAEITVSDPENQKVVDAFVVRIADDATFDPAVDTVQSQALASQTALRARGGV